MAWWAFQNIVATAALALVVALICRVPRLNPVVRHALWVLVLVKFITPPLMAWPWSVPDPLGIRTVTIQTESDPVSSATAFPSRVDDQAIDVSSVPELPASMTSAAPIHRATTALTFATMWPWLAGLWILGALVVLLVECARLFVMAREVRRGTPADPAIVERVRVFANRLDVKPIPVIALRQALSPAVWCLGRPRLLWPAELPAEFTDACIDGLIVHELAHVKRRDHMVGWIELAASVVWWWNPLFWYVRSAMREQAELACDGWVVAALPNGRRAYAESLLALSSMVTAPDAPASPIAAVLGVRARSRRALERRLVMIMKGRASRQLSTFGLVGLAVLAAATLPVWATGSEQTPPPTTSNSAPSPQSESLQRTFYLRYASIAEVQSLLQQMLPAAATANQLSIETNRSTNTLIARGSESMLSAVKSIIESVDKPRGSQNVAGGQVPPPPPPPPSPATPPPPPAPQTAVPVMATTASRVPPSAAPGMPVPVLSATAPQQVPPPPPPAPPMPRTAPPPPPPAPPAPGVATMVTPDYPRPIPRDARATTVPAARAQGGATDVPAVVVRGQAPAVATTVQQYPTATSVQRQGTATTTVQTPRPATVSRSTAQGGTATAPSMTRVYGVNSDSLPAEGQEAVKKYEAQRTTIQQEAEKKVETERTALIKSLTAMQEQYTKAGKLDEAIAVRDYIKMLDSGRDLMRTVIRR